MPKCHTDSRTRQLGDLARIVKAVVLAQLIHVLALVGILVCRKCHVIANARRDKQFVPIDPIVVKLMKAIRETRQFKDEYR